MGAEARTAPLSSYSEGAKLGIPVGLAVNTAAPIIALSARFNESDRRERARRPRGPAGDLQKIDEWIADGVLGGDQLNAADYQIGPSLRLPMTFDDLRPMIEERPRASWRSAVAPDFPGRLPAVVPAAWLEPLTGQPRLA